MKTQEQIQQRINFIQQQLDSLDKYLPTCYQLLMEEMDYQKREMMQLKIQEFYRSQS